MIPNATEISRMGEISHEVKLRRRRNSVRFRNQLWDTMDTASDHAHRGDSAAPASGSDAGDPLAIRFAPKAVLVDRLADGSILLRSPIPLTGCVGNIVDYLEHWAAAAPERTFLAQKAADGTWERLCYADAWQRVQAIAQWLLHQGLSDQTPIAILSGASLEHAVLAFAGMLVGVPVSPVSPSQRAGGSGDGELSPAAYAAIAARLAERLQVHNRSNSGNTHRVAAFRILHTPASIGAGETTDKGYVNQRGMLTGRAALVDALYSAQPGPEVIRL